MKSRNMRLDKQLWAQDKRGSRQTDLGWTRGGNAI